MISVHPERRSPKGSAVEGGATWRSAPHRASGLVLLALLAAAPSLAADAPVAGAKLAIDIEPVAGATRWYATALEQLVAKEASRFSRVAVVEKLADTAACARDSDCLVALYAKNGIDVVVLGTLDSDSLSWEVHETWTPNRLKRGTLSVGGPNVTSRRVQHGIAELVRPIVSSGGLLDKRPVAKGPAAPAPAESGALTGSGRLALGSFALALAALLLWPALLLLMLVGRKVLRARPPLRAWRWSAAVVAALGVVAALAFLGLDPLGPLPHKARDPLFPVLGGLLWGALGVLHVGFLLPPLHGLSRIRHDALGPTLRAWVSLCALRFGALVLWTPLLLATLYVARTAQLPSHVTTGLLVPAVGLYGCFFLASLTEHLSIWLDERLGDGPPNARNAWHATIRKYFMGYVKRGGLVLDRGFLAQVLFLPGKPDTGFAVHAYGGALGPPRILVGWKAISAALGELPDEPEAPDRVVNLEELPLGFVMPAEDESAAAQARAEKLRKRLTSAPPKARAHSMPRLLGEPTTALGWVVPQPVDEAVPLISNTREDYEVVKSLLTEHYGRFEKNLDEEDHDDTDPTQKDFLFGPLMSAAGAFTRRDTLASTIGLSFELAMPRASWLSRRVLRLCFGLHLRFLAWPRAVVADAFAALNGALHPLMQHLHLSRGGWDQLLTARADLPRLIETSKTLLEALTAKEPEGKDAQLWRPGERNRMLWLAPFFAARLARPWPGWLRALTLAGAVAVIAIAAGNQVREALDYRPIYVDRMTQMRAMADQAAQGAKTK